MCHPKNYRGEKPMQEIEQGRSDLALRTYSTREVLNHGANWFLWLGVLSAINSLIVFYFGTVNMPFALGLTQWVDGTTGGLTAEGWSPPLHAAGLAMNLLVAAVFASFAYFAR